MSGVYCELTGAQYDRISYLLTRIDGYEQLLDEIFYILDSGIVGV
jgi:hypothetical protein